MRVAAEMLYALHSVADLAAEFQPPDSYKIQTVRASLTLSNQLLILREICFTESYLFINVVH